MTVLFVGASGCAGRSILSRLTPERDVVLLSRGMESAGLKSNQVLCRADILNKHQLINSLAGKKITQVIFAASIVPQLSSYSPFNVAAIRKLGQRYLSEGGLTRGDYIKAARLTNTLDLSRAHFQMFSNVCDALIEGGHPVEHMMLVTGGRYYGIHLGPIGDPLWSGLLAENSRRHDGVNWYFDVEDYARVISKNRWPVSTLRPSYILYDGGGLRQNIMHSLCLYLELQRQRGANAVFPGGAGNYDCSWSMTPGYLLGDFADWLIDTKKAWGESFNVVAKDPLVWSDFWPRLASLYDLTVEINRKPLSLGLHSRSNAYCADLLNKYGYSINAFTPLDFIDQAMVCTWDMVYSMEKAASFGFDATASIMDCFSSEVFRLQQFNQSQKTFAA